MGKYYGKIGYMNTVETSPGIYTEQVVERAYYGDFLRNSSKFQTSGNLNDNVTINNEINILADPYAFQNFHSLRYITYMDVKWKVVNVEVQYPRLILAVGGVYNGET